VLPPGQYRDLNGGDALIIPLESVAGEWRDRPWSPGDAAAFSPTRFRCVAFQPQVEGGGSCGHHDADRPEKCGDFPVGGAAIENELKAVGEVWLQIEAFPRCSWFGICIVSDSDPRMTSPARSP
jgi:hypothetical protein